jgi:hypothetical protein
MGLAVLPGKTLSMRMPYGLISSRRLSATAPDAYFVAEHEVSPPFRNYSSARIDKYHLTGPRLQ